MISRVSKIGCAGLQQAFMASFKLVRGLLKMVSPSITLFRTSVVIVLQSSLQQGKFQIFAAPAFAGQAVATSRFQLLSGVVQFIPIGLAVIIATFRFLSYCIATS
jgi:hypothetical protein